MMRQSKAVIFYDGKCGLCRVIAKILSKIDVFNKFLLLDLWKDLSRYKTAKLSKKRLKEEIHLIDSDGVIYSGYGAFKQVFKKIPFLFPLRMLAMLPASDYLGKKIYLFIASNRYKIIPCSGECQIN